MTYEHSILLAAARACVAAGLSVIPIRADGSKAPCVRWDVYQKRRPTDAELWDWYGAGTPRGLGIVCGRVSGGLEVMDFDVPAAYGEWRGLCDDHDLGALTARLPVVATPSGGFHVYYRCPEPGKNAKLSRTHDRIIKIETRGEGGMVLAPPSPPECHPSRGAYRFLSGGIHAIPYVTADERRALHTMARILDEEAKPEILKLRPPDPQTRKRVPRGVEHEVVDVDSLTSESSAILCSAPPGWGSGGRKPAEMGSRPGDEYNAHGDYEGVLKKHGWRKVGIRDGVGLWRRPGKAFGISATTNYGGARLFYVFSTNAAPFEPETSYTPLGVYATLEHGGDYRAAARALRDLTARREEASPPAA